MNRKEVEKKEDRPGEGETQEEQIAEAMNTQGPLGNKKPEKKKRQNGPRG